DADVALGSRFLSGAEDVPWIKRTLLKAVAALSPAARRLQLTDAHNGLRVLNRAAASQLKITMNGMAHASEIVDYLARSELAVTAVLRPDWVNWLAHKIDVGRGTDLVLYALATAFVFVSVNTYFRLKTQEARFTDLARAIAVRDATELNAERFGVRR